MALAPHIEKAQKHDCRVNAFITICLSFVSVMLFISAFIVIGYLTNGFITTALFSAIGSFAIYKIVNRDK